MPNDPAWLELRPALRAAKREGVEYFPGDTHWNDLGAYHGYRAIMRRLGLPALAHDPDKLVRGSRPVDLARMSGVMRKEPTTYYRRRCESRRPSSVDPALFDADRAGAGGTPAFSIPATVCPTGHGRLLVFQELVRLGLVALSVR